MKISATLISVKMAVSLPKRGKKKIKTIRSSRITDASLGWMTVFHRYSCS